MQRCCARIAGLRTFACRSNLQRATPLVYCHPRRRYAQLSPRRDKDPDDSDFDLETLIGADNDAEADIDGGLRGQSRQSWVRHRNALGKGGFAYIDPSKLPARDDAQSYEAWMPIIEAALPARLRQTSTTPSGNHSYSAQDVSRIIHISSYTYGLDLLTHLAVKEKRWKAAVWLASQVVKHDFKPDPPPPRDRNVWTTRLPPSASLQTLTAQERGISLPLDINQPDISLRPLPSLDQLTADLHPHHEPLPNILRHETLGQLWQSLGQMIILDAQRANRDTANQAIQPEILEIIAMLHHSGAMPSSIYSYQPADDSSSLRQPPTLHLLSNQIMTSLTDAAWRAHELTVVEEAKEKGGVYKSIRPEIPGSMYKVHVTGLGHEVWLELVLWACLYGRFYERGAFILRQLSNLSSDEWRRLVADLSDEDAWSVLSWRELVNPIIQSGQEKSINWDEVKYIFNTGVSYSDQPDNKMNVRRTVSAEVIASFVDATVSHIRSGVGSRGITPGATAKFLVRMKSYLQRNNMSLGFTSWDAIALRFLESKGVDLEKGGLALAPSIIKLSSMFGDEISAINAPTRDQLWQSTPAYVLDGTAAAIGHMHRLLRAHIRIGSLRGAVEVFKDLQKVTDKNKERSIQEFFAKQQLATKDLAAEDDNEEPEPFGFEGRYGGIHYPNFFPQIPVPILADFLDLIVDADALDLGSWLLFSQDVDGPIIGTRMYGDEIMAPPLVRLAAKLGDKELMKQIFEAAGRQHRDLPKNVLTAILEQQIEAGNWSFVDKALENFTTLPGYSVSTNTTAIVIRMILREAKACDGDFSKLEASEASKMFRKMTNLPAPERAPSGYRSLPNIERFPQLAGRIWRLLALVNDDWREYAWKVYPNIHGRGAFRFIQRGFNVILDGVLDAYGTEAGKQYLGKFWPEALIPLSPRDTRINDASGGVPRMAARRRDTPTLTSPFRHGKYGEHRIRIEGPNDRRAILTVDLRTKPNVATIQLVLQRALREHQGQPDLMRQDAEWARQMMKRLGLEDSFISKELRGLAASDPHTFASDEQSEDIKDILGGDLDDGVDELDEL